MSMFCKLPQSDLKSPTPCCNTQVQQALGQFCVLEKPAVILIRLILESLCCLTDDVLIAIELRSGLFVSHSECSVIFPIVRLSELFWLVFVASAPVFQ